jgi:hypothetical protein
VAALAHQLARLIGPFHVAVSGLADTAGRASAASADRLNQVLLPFENRAAYKEPAVCRQFRRARCARRPRAPSGTSAGACETRPISHPACRRFQARLYDLLYMRPGEPYRAPATLQSTIKRLYAHASTRSGTEVGTWSRH